MIEYRLHGWGRQLLSDDVRMSLDVLLTISTDLTDMAFRSCRNHWQRNVRHWTGFMVMLGRNGYILAAVMTYVPQLFVSVAFGIGEHVFHWHTCNLAGCP
ncbi:hypothetical protein FUT69_02585 [Xylella taiwanensis]|uniref:Uncharacterized protein n=1 Tax=Xylella taiwanensis TaxID=1444770 RepID=Z9JJ44_9GAMM|nr:hypothetical protein [Xylella taiwanensis]AXI83991.1 hypothetical protein AB672_08615 [Xylella taiwanensis]EWS77856.1 hypothetical protein AF72_08745 [Xylella taiwanensis]MCD8457101.1 hypothetical protein [Xylella taiwanensis]MCD8459509.1 hypothetical protein [Xylella taiwanensis]MCD8461622.1 hypothetical protein [Xylella taiwanensis]